MMVAIDGDPLVYVYYEDGTWEQVPRGDGNVPPDAPGQEGTDTRPLLPMPFGRVLAGEGRHLLLGEPLQTEPARSETIVQPFFGGLAVGNKNSGQILFLARSKLRF
jgi:hypothetical protein